MQLKVQIRLVSNINLKFELGLDFHFLNEMQFKHKLITQFMKLATMGHHRHNDIEDIRIHHSV